MSSIYQDSEPQFTIMKLGFISVDSTLIFDTSNRNIIYAKIDIII